MKLLFGSLLIFTVLFISSCGSSYKAVAFKKMRTPLNPLAHKGVNEYTPVAHIEYAQQALLAREHYNREVQKRTKEYEEALKRYNEATIVERITQGLVKPELILPEAPFMPYIINSAELENKINIEGMQKSTGNGLMVNVYVEDFQYSKLTINDTVKKSVKDGVEQIDSIYSASAEVFQPLRLKVVAPNGESYSNQITTSRKPKKISTQNFYTRHKAENKIYELIHKEEQNLYLSNVTTVNQVLNDQFGTQLVSYTVHLFQVNSDKHDYSDLKQANILAQIGFKQLHENPNKAYENLAQAYGIWKAALKEHDSYKKARINDKVKQGLLINLLATATFTDNWTEVVEFNTLLENMKLTGATTTEFRRLKTIQNDLKKRHDAIRN